MKKLIGSAIAIVLIASCAAQRDAETQVSTDSYKAAVTKVQSNLETLIEPAVAAVLSSDTTHSADWKKAKLDLIEDSISLCKDTLAGKNAGVTPVGSAK